MLKPVSLVRIFIAVFFAATIVASHPWNSDVLYPQSLYDAFFKFGLSIRGFHFSACTFLIPDFGIYALARSIFSNLSLVLWAYCSISILFFQFVIERITQSRNPWVGPIAVVLFFALFNYNWNPLFIPVHHGGQYLLALFLAASFLRKPEETPSFATAIMLGVVASCDLDCGVNVLAPLGTWAFVNFLYHRRADIFLKQITWFAVCAVSTIAFYFGMKFLLPAHYGWNKVHYESWREKAFFAYFTHFTFFNAVAWAALVTLAIRFRKDTTARFFLIATGISALFISVSASWDNDDTVRYFYPLVISILYAAYTWAKAVRKREPKLFPRVAIAVLVAVCVVKMFSSVHYMRQSPMDAPYSNTLNCVDQVAKENHITSAMGDYWAAKYITYFSHENVKVLQATAQLQPYFWINNEDDYSNFHPNAAITANDFVPPPNFLKQYQCGNFRVSLYDHTLW